MQYFAYVLRCADDSLYAGYTTDLTRRLAEHNGQSDRPGAKYTKSRRPVKLVFQKSFKTRGEAMSFEATFKRLSRKEKLALIS